MVKPKKIYTMKEYLLLFWNQSGEEGYQPSPEEMQKGMQAWQAWIGGIAAQGKLIDSRPIMWHGAQVRHTGTMAQPVVLAGDMVTGYMLCKAEHFEEVEAWSKSCPILHYPGGYTEIREIAPFEL